MVLNLLTAHLNSSITTKEIAIEGTIERVLSEEGLLLAILHEKMWLLMKYA